MTLRRCYVPFFCLAIAACGQQPAAPPAPKPAVQDPAAAGRALAEQMRKQFADEKITIDLAAKTVTVPAVMNDPQDLEYLLIHRRGKKHEAMFYTESKPSVLNMALLLLGFEPGKNATYKEKEPPPTLEEIEKGADPLIVTPPSGMQIWMTVKWKGADGKPVEYCIEDLLGDLTTGEAVRDASFIFLGGRTASIYRNEPEIFVADVEGNLVSICYLTPDNHLATMKHERARDDENWWMMKAVPAPGTEVEFTFHREMPKLMVERNKRLAEEDAKKKAETGKEAPKDPPKEPGK